MSEPDPPTLLLWKRASETPKRARVFSLRGTPKILRKEGKTHKKQGKARKTHQSKEIEKGRDLEGQGGYFMEQDLLASVRKGRAWAIAVRRASYRSLFLLNSGRFSQKKTV